MKSIRGRLGLSQWQMAQLLGITKSVLSMAELGLRQLPTPCTLLLARLEMMLQNGEVAMAGKLLAPLEKKQHTQLAKTLQKQSRKASTALFKAENSLQTMVDLYQQQLQLLQAIMVLQAEAAPQSQQMAGLNVLHQEALARLDRCGRGPQMLLQYRIGVLKHQQQAAKEIIHLM